MKLETGGHLRLRLRLRLRVSDGLNLGERFGECREVSGGCVATEEKEDVAPSVL